MKGFKRFWPLALVAVLALIVSSFGNQTMPAMAGGDDMYSSNMILLNLDNDEVICEKKSDEIIYPASLTKIMTAILAIEMLGEDGLKTRMIMPEEVFEDLTAKNASMAGFAPGEKLCAADLLYGMMLPSGADGAVGMAVNLCGSEEVFVEKMNEKAKMLQMNHTHFVNVTGLHDKNHYSTLEDLSILLKYALKNETFRKVFTTGMYETSASKEHPEGIVLESTLFSKMSVEALEDLALLGGKTGFTDKAGLCLATLASCGQKEYILITAGAKARTSANPFHIIDAMKIYSGLE